MSRVREILDRLNDIEATITQVGSRVTDETALAIRLSVRSLENRRDMLKEELADATRENFIEICDYRIIPDERESYAISAITGALQHFQELVTIVFDAITTEPKKRAVYNADIIEKTRFDFGFSYSGSLGMAMVIENERLLAIESKLDQTIDVVFGLLRADNSESIHDAAILYGLPSIRKLYSLSKVHRDYGMSAEIKWVRDGETKKKVLTQQQEFDQLCQIIETRGDEEVESATLTGTLATWDTVGRRFILVFPEAEPVRGTFAEAFDASSPRTVQDRYEVKLLKRTAFNYVTDQERISWELIGIAEIK